MKWEYEVFFLGDPGGPNGHGLVNTRMAELGQEGWELVSVVKAWGYFKRSLVEPEPFIITGISDDYFDDDVTVTHVGKPCDSTEECCE